MPEAVVLDVEGTTSSVDRLHQELLPYARARLDAWVSEHGHERQTRTLLDQVDRMCGRPAGQDDEATVRTLLAWSDSGSRAAPLRTLQDLIWHEGYTADVLCGHVYADTLLALCRWRDRGARVYVYAPRSVQAQRDLFGHTQFGDIRGRFAGHFETGTTGARCIARSYRRIAREIGAAPEQVLCVSGTVADLDAARAAGCRTAWVMRPEERGYAAAFRAAAPAGYRAYQTLTAVAEEAFLPGEVHPEPRTGTLTGPRTGGTEPCGG